MDAHNPAHGESPRTMVKGTMRTERVPRPWEMTQRELDQQTWLDDHLTDYYRHEHGLRSSLRRMFGGPRHSRGASSNA